MTPVCIIPPINKAKKADYVIAVENRIVRGVFKVNQWQQANAINHAQDDKLSQLNLSPRV